MSSKVDLPPHLAAAVQQETKGQRIIWIGQSNASRAFAMGLAIWLFAIPWTVFAVGWETAALYMFFGAPAQAAQSEGKFLMGIFSIVFPIFGLPFVLIGLGMLSTPFWSWHTARNTASVLTETNLISVSAYRRGTRTVASNAVSQFVSVTRTERADGSGDLSIMAGQERDSDGDLRDKTHTLVGIVNVRDVEQRLRAAMANVAR